MRPLITLLTDFGTADGYVAQMKGVIHTLVPEASIVDVSHEIAPHDVESARLTLARYWRRFPPRTIHVVIVDPGVGSDRACLAVASEERFFLGPDNGVLSPAMLLPGAEIVALPIPPNAAPTFHGRDVFAPAAAALAGGVSLAALGAPFPAPHIRRTPETQRRRDGAIEGQVISIDRFGNAVTNIAFVSRGSAELIVGSRVVPIVTTYADVERGAACGVVGSTGLIEVSVREGNAASTLELARGDSVVLRMIGR